MDIDGVCNTALLAAADEMPSPKRDNEKRRTDRILSFKRVCDAHTMWR